jgi:hypothetical protein
VLPDRSATSTPMTAEKLSRSLWVARATHSKLCGRREECEMAMIKEVRCLPHTEVRHLAPGLRSAQGGQSGTTSGAHEWRIANINGVDVSIHRASICSMSSQVLCRGLHDEAKHPRRTGAGRSFGNWRSRGVGR